MKDIKSLYLTAKISGRRQDITSYTEAVHDLLEHHPTEFISNLEYIISSDMNISTLNEFVNKYGLSIPVCNLFIESLNDCIEKCESRQLSSSLYKEALDYFKEFKDHHSNCFNMFKYYAGDNLHDYIPTYYSFNEKGIQGRRLPAGMIKTFGEAAIPDMIISAESMDACEQLFEYLNKGNTISDPTVCQWITECINDINVPLEELSLSNIHDRSLGSIVKSIQSRSNSVIREAAIMGNDDSVIEYTESDINSIRDLISFKEYQLTCLESVNDIIKLQNEIYSLYEEFDGLINEDDSVNIEIDESLRHVNTRNKYTGDAPGYLSNNHNLRYGEDDSIDKKDDEKSLEDYRRPSASDDNEPEPSYPDNDPEPEEDDDLEKDKRAINNYYYYTYTNSLNKNSNSFNRSNTDDHSTNKGDNRGNVNDNHSSGDNRGNVNDNHSSGDNRGNVNNYKKESSKPWELDIFGTKVYNEAAAILSEGILDIFKNRKNETPKTSEQHNEKYINVSSSDFDTIELRLKSLESKFRNKIEPICNKYPAYAMRTTGIDDWLKWYGARWLHEVFGECVKIIDGKIDTPQAEFGVIGADTYTFFNMLKNDDPNEYQRIASMYDLESRFEMVDVQWGEKLCGYDKTLNEITDDITSIIKNEFPMIIDYDYTGDNDSGPVYSGRISHQYIYDGIVPSDILTLNEAVGDADDMKPESDHPVRETLQDVDRKLLKVQQGAKKKVQSVMNAGRTFMKPAKRTHQWVTKLVNDWKDNDENKIKEKLADPTARKNIFNAIAWSIKTGSFLKAGLLLNPIFLFLTITKNVGKNKKEFRLRNEMIGELKTELKVIDEKIKDADYNHDNQAKYKLMRLKNEIEKKLARVGGSYTRSWRKLV